LIGEVLRALCFFQLKKKTQYFYTSKGLSSTFSKIMMEGGSQGSRGTKRTREEMGGSNDGTTNILVEVTTGEGVTAKLQLPPTATVLMVKQEMESELGIRPREACVFSSNVAHTEKLPDEELLASLFTGGE
jgi:hypothetical protein